MLMSKGFNQLINYFFAIIIFSKTYFPKFIIDQIKHYKSKLNQDFMVFWVEKRRHVSLIMFLLIALEIFYVSSIPGSGTGAHIPLVATIYHLSAFFLFSFFLFFLIKGDKKINSFYIMITLISAVIYAVLDEIHQSFVPLRNPSVGDVFTDFIGLSVSLFLAVYISKKASQ